MLVLPRLPADNATYILTLESTLSKSTHSYENTVIYFESDGSYKSFDIEFTPKVKSSEQELRQTSLLVVPLLGLLALAYLHRDTLLQRLLAAAGGAAAARAAGRRQHRPHRQHGQRRRQAAAQAEGAVDRLHNTATH